MREISKEELSPDIPVITWGPITSVGTSERFWIVQEPVSDPEESDDGVGDE